MLGVGEGVERFQNQWEKSVRFAIPAREADSYVADLIRHVQNRAQGFDLPS